MPSEGIDTTYLSLALHVDPVWLASFGALWRNALDPDLAATVQYAQYTSFDEEGFTESQDIQYGTTEIPGRGESLFTFTGGANRGVDIEFSYHAYKSGLLDAVEKVDESYNSARASTGLTGEYGSKTIEGTQTWLMKRVAWFQRFNTPLVDTFGIAYAPPPVVLVIGSFFAMRAVVTGVTPKWNGPFDPQTNIPHGVDITVSLQSALNIPETAPAYASLAASVPTYRKHLTFMF